MPDVELIVSTRTILLGETADQGFVDLLREVVNEIEIYEQRFIPGVIYASAKQWKVVGNVNALAGILSAALTFYLAYKPETPKAGSSEPQIIVKIENAGQNNIFRIGPNIKDQQDLVKQLRDSLTLLKTQLELQQTKAALDSLRHSPHWKRVH